MRLDAPNFQHLVGSEALATDRGTLALTVDGDGNYAPLTAGGGGGGSVTLTPRCQNISPGFDWNAGDVSGTLTSVTAIVTSGTMNFTDGVGQVSSAIPTGVTMSFSVGDSSELDTSMLNVESVGGMVLVIWTERP